MQDTGLPTTTVLGNPFKSWPKTHYIFFVSYLTFMDYISNVSYISLSLPRGSHGEGRKTGVRFSRKPLCEGFSSIAGARRKVVERQTQNKEEHMLSRQRILLSVTALAALVLSLAGVALASPTGDADPKGVEDTPSVTQKAGWIEFTKAKEEYPLKNSSTFVKQGKRLPRWNLQVLGTIGASARTRSS
jgi:hypothetical protein